MRNLLWAIFLVTLLAGCGTTNPSSHANGQLNTQQQDQRQMPPTIGY
jgi:hypothetical protein